MIFLLIENASNPARKQGNYVLKRTFKIFRRDISIPFTTVLKVFNACHTSSAWYHTRLLSLPMLQCALCNLCLISNHMYDILPVYSGAENRLATQPDLFVQVLAIVSSTATDNALQEKRSGCARLINILMI